MPKPYTIRRQYKCGTALEQYGTPPAAEPRGLKPAAHGPRGMKPTARGPRRAGLALLVSAFVLGPVHAQYQIDTGGRLFDANPQLYGGRYNAYVRPVPPLVGGNPFATGNVGRGMSLRSFSPIHVPGELHVPLGTSSLSNFIRDSVSVADQAVPLGGLAPLPFIDPALTAPTASYLRGLYDFQPIYPAQVPTETGSVAMSPFRDVLPYGSPPQWPRGLESTTRRPDESIGMPLNTELSSTIFGLEPPGLPGPLAERSWQPPSTYLPEMKADEFGSELSPPSVAGTQEPLDFRVWPTLPVEPGPTALDIAMQEDATRLLTERPVPTLPLAEEIAATPWTDLHPQEPGAAGGQLGPELPSAAGGLYDPTAVLGKDVFTDMQLALELALNPQADWLTRMSSEAGLRQVERSPFSPESATETPELAMERQARAAEATEEFLTRMFEMPLQTFVGEAGTAVNEELRKAEAAMDRGRYYDAVQCYERVRQLDPANPLALIGKGHALLAAGEYVSAAVSLIRSFEQFPEMARFDVDLMALLGGGEIVDIRRADLMKQLARHEDPRLRFLLGYIEIHTGQRELGLKNLDRAAQEAQPDSLIHRYPEMIRRRGMSPASTPLPAAGLDSATDATAPPGSDQPTPGEESE
jgi:tetratricopeptide (TPR) repeat protein